MPGHDLQTQHVQHGSEPAREMVQAHGMKVLLLLHFTLDEDLKKDIL